MTLEDIIKALKDKDVDGATVSAIKALDNSAEVERLTGELSASEGKAAGILADKKKAQEERDSFKAKVEEAENSKLTSEEKIQKQIDDLQKAKEDAEAKFEQQGKSFAEKERENAVLKAGGGIRWENMPASSANLIVKAAFDGVEMSDQKKVDEVLATLKETHKANIAADVPSGSGGKSGGDGGTNKPAVDSTVADAVAGAWIK